MSTIENCKAKLNHKNSNNEDHKLNNKLLPINCKRCFLSHGQAAYGTNLFQLYLNLSQCYILDPC